MKHSPKEWLAFLEAQPMTEIFMFLKKLCSRGSWVDLQRFLTHCTNAVMCASLFFWMIAAASNAVVWHLTPALPFCWERAELKPLPAALLVEEISASDPWCVLSRNGLCLTTGSRGAVSVSSTPYHLLATPVCIPLLRFCGAKSFLGLHAQGFVWTDTVLSWFRG